MTAVRRPFRLTERIAPEDELHADVAHALWRGLPPDVVWTTWELRNASGPIEGRRRKDLGALAGWPDIGVLWDGRLALLELKRSRYGCLSPAQRALHPRLAAAGHPVSVVRSVNEALEALRAVGCPVRMRVMA